MVSIVSGFPGSQATAALDFIDITPSGILSCGYYCLRAKLYRIARPPYKCRSGAGSK